MIQLLEPKEVVSLTLALLTSVRLAVINADGLFKCGWKAKKKTNFYVCYSTLLSSFMHECLETLCMIHIHINIGQNFKKIVHNSLGV